MDEKKTNDKCEDENMIGDKSENKWKITRLSKSLEGCANGAQS